MIRSFGYDVKVKSVHDRYPSDFDMATVEIIDRVWHPDQSKRLTMTSPERLHAFCNAVQYVVRNNIGGAIVECGVWKGGSMMAAAMMLTRLDSRDRELFLFDTFEGMTEPTDLDRDQFGKAAADRLATSDKETSWVWAACGLEDVKKNLASTGYDSEKVHFVEGPVEATLPSRAPEKIAVLRLDTDWYESTKHELDHLYPRLVPGGVLIIDDYGHWEGARRAVDEFLDKCDHPLLLNRIDGTGRIAVKPY